MAKRRRKTKSDTSTYVCSRLWQKGKTFYVGAVPGQGGKDWGYETHPGRAVPISAYWQRRFKADMRHVGAQGVNCRRAR